MKSTDEIHGKPRLRHKKISYFLSFNFLSCWVYSFASSKKKKETIQPTFCTVFANYNSPTICKRWSGNCTKHKTVGRFFCFNSQFGNKTFFVNSSCYSLNIPFDCQNACDWALDSANWMITDLFFSFWKRRMFTRSVRPALLVWSTRQNTAVCR